ncbi:hypothetical protein [Pseudonocardia broussonetiae]|uniref:Uncharacterized protein n=1 Tax=Pseudonocardia broussonetiae TaxID=2736640 RepID=A0A6M6JVW6_9PSEU|nr:hypothetical protein [Pseudonocardia broussonetiae]QJY51196.1 hypothetical protein HOP40_35065 [Pseudonocardia broussonetiae]QJY51197.1 hypothetical protein HOP40_35140 [Pseudonocardia broussonetiae]
MAKLAMPDLPEGRLKELMRALHELHARAGWPSTREIAHSQDFSYTTVHQLFTKTNQLPKLPVLLAIVSNLASISDPNREEQILDKFDALWCAAAATPPAGTEPTWSKDRLDLAHYFLEYNGDLVLPVLGTQEKVVLSMLLDSYSLNQINAEMWAGPKSLRIVYPINSEYATRLFEKLCMNFGARTHPEARPRFRGRVYNPNANMQYLRRTRFNVLHLESVIADV